MFIERKKSAQSIWFLDLMHEKTLRVLSCTPFGYLLTSCPGQLTVLVFEKDRNSILNAVRIQVCNL